VQVSGQLEKFAITYVHHCLSFDKTTLLCVCSLPMHPFPRKVGDAVHGGPPLTAARSLASSHGHNRCASIRRCWLAWSV